MTVSLFDLLVQETKATIYAKALVIAQGLGLPVATWSDGDPTRSTYWILAEILESVEQVAAEFFKAGFLSEATGDWLVLLAKQVYGVDATPATYATSTVVLRNTGGGVYPVAAGDVVLRSSISGKTYRNTTAGTIPAVVGVTPGELSIDVVADEPGSDSSAGANEIDEMVTVYLGVSPYTSTAAIGLDAESDKSLRARCTAQVGSLSPNGPSAAYVSAATNPVLTGTNNVTKASVVANSTNGTVTVYVAGPSGTVIEADRAKSEAAILAYATPLCITPTVLAASEVVVDIVYTMSVYAEVNLTEAQIATAVSSALDAMFADLPIGGDEGKLYKTKIQAAIFGAVSNVYSVAVSLPAGDVSLTASQVAKRGTVTVSPAITVTA
jgi:phage-related baseplate assembly protein